MNRSRNYRNGRSYFYYLGDQLTATSDGNTRSSLQLWGAEGLVGTRNALTSPASQNAQGANHGAAAQRHEQ